MPRALLSENLTAVAKHLSPDALRSWTALMKAVRHYWGITFSRAHAINKAFQDGTLDRRDYDAFLDAMLGLDGSHRTETNGADRHASTGAEVSYSLGNIDPTKIKSYLDGTYEPGPDDHAAARGLERLIRQDKSLLREFGGRVPQIRPASHLQGHEFAIGAAFGAAWGRFVGVYDTGGVEAPGGFNPDGRPHWIAINSQGIKPAHLRVGHELWHSLGQSKRPDAAASRNSPREDPEFGLLTSASGEIRIGEILEVIKGDDILKHLSTSETSFSIVRDYGTMATNYDSVNDLTIEDLGPEPESHRRFREEVKRKIAEESAKISPEEREADAKATVKMVEKALSVYFEKEQS